jgi:hypothetical protein
VENSELEVVKDTVNRTISINNVVYHYDVFEFLANPDPSMMYKFLKEKDGPVNILARDEVELVQFLREELRRAENEIDALRNSRDSSVSLAQTCRAQVDELVKQLDKQTDEEVDNGIQ